MSDIKPLNWTTKTLALLSYLSLGFQVIYTGRSWALSRQGHCIPMLASGFSLPGMRSIEYGLTDGLQYVDTPEAHTVRWPLSP